MNDADVKTIARIIAATRLRGFNGTNRDSKLSNPEKELIRRKTDAAHDCIALSNSLLEVWDDPAETTHDATSFKCAIAALVGDTTYE